ncbi:hypothetical protein OOK29_48030 [Streptomyces phaeochromogenes]|uniref:hypothetical protein n=1 Tax=Streptomyces phaeochromogenes TaxID=1923 RepID=UPI0022525E82|nr:hypothetical protein [Streptomyces phaeochromogenes]MCX5605877.1 hypothetical protein [Streptomyces phaeochromogenes]
MATKVDNEAWEKWPDEVLNEVNAASWGLGSEPVSGDYSNRPWDEWKKPGQSWVATSDEDFTNAWDFAVEVWREGTISLGVDVIVWSPEVVFFRFVDCTDKVAEREAVQEACRGTRKLRLDPIRCTDDVYLDCIVMDDAA